MTQMVKNPPTMWETWIRSLGWEDPLEEDMATHSSILAWGIPMDRGAWRATVHGVTESDMAEHVHATPYTEKFVNKAREGSTVCLLGRLSSADGSLPTL